MVCNYIRSQKGIYFLLVLCRYAVIHRSEALECQTKHRTTLNFKLELSSLIGPERFKGSWLPLCCFTTSLWLKQIGASLSHLCLLVPFRIFHLYLKLSHVFFIFYIPFLCFFFILPPSCSETFECSFWFPAWSQEMKGSVVVSLFAWFRCDLHQTSFKVRQEVNERAKDKIFVSPSSHTIVFKWNSCLMRLCPPCNSHTTNWMMY